MHARQLVSAIHRQQLTGNNSHLVPEDLRRSERESAPVADRARSDDCRSALDRTGVAFAEYSDGKAAGSEESAVLSVFAAGRLGGIGIARGLLSRATLSSFLLQFDSKGFGFFDAAVQLFEQGRHLGGISARIG